MNSFFTVTFLFAPYLDHDFLVLFEFELVWKTERWRGLIILFFFFFGHRACGIEEGIHRAWTPP